MPSMTKLALSALALFAYSAEAAPLLSGLGGKTSTAAITTSDLKVFVDAFLKTSTGGKYDNCDNVDLGVVSSLTASLKAQALSKVALTQCVASYSDVVACTEFTAYLATAYYGYISGWTGATLFAALESTRVDRFHGLLSGFCGAPGCPTGVCNDWTNQWDIFEYASATVKADVKASAKVQLQLSGLLSVCDTAAILKAGIDGTIKVTTAVSTKVVSDVHPTVDAALQTYTNVEAKVKSDLNIIASTALSISASAFTDLKAQIHALAVIATGIKSDVKDKCQSLDFGLIGANVNVDADIKADLNVIAAVTAVADVAASADLKAKITALVAVCADLKAKAAVGV